MPRYYHVTPAANVNSIAMRGLLPAIGERSALIGEPHPAVYLFTDEDALENACMNWLEEYFDDHAELALYAVDIKAKQIPRYAAEYEIIMPSAIAPENLTLLSLDLMSEVDLKTLLKSPVNTVTRNPLQRGFK